MSLDFCDKIDLLLRHINCKFHYVQLSQEILVLFAQDGGRMILLAQQVKKSTLTSSARYKQIIDKPTYVGITIRHTLTLYFVLTKTQFQIMELMFQSLILTLVRLKFMYHSLQYISVKSGIIVKQIRQYYESNI